MDQSERDRNIRIHTALDLTKQAGQSALEIQTWLKPEDIKHKSEALSNVVTIGDLEVKRILVEGIRKKFPEDSIYSEESESVYSQKNSKFGWKIDEIDCTLGYSHQFPEWSVSAGLEQNGQSILGILNFPALRRFFVADDHDVTENGHRMRTSSIEKLTETVIYLAGPHISGPTDLEEKLYPYERVFVDKTQYVYREPCGTLTMMRIARGEIGAFLHTGGLGTNDDLGAGPFIIREAGGIHSKIDPTKARQTFLAAANQEIYDQVINLLGSELVSKLDLQL